MLPSHYLNVDEFHELIPVLAYDPEKNLFLLEDNALAFGFVFEPMPGADDAAADRLGMILNERWEKGTMLQCVQIVSGDLKAQLDQFVWSREEAMLGRKEKRRGKPISDEEERALRDQESLVIETSKRQAAHLRNGNAAPIVQQQRLRVNDGLTYLTIRVPISGPTPNDTEIDICTGRAEQVRAQLKSAGVSPRNLTPHLWLRAMEVVLNQSESASWRRDTAPVYDEERPICDQVLDPGSRLHVQRDKIELDDDFVLSMMCVKKYPDQCYFGMAREYLADLATGSRGLRENCFLYATVYFGDAEDDKLAVGAERTWVTHSSYGPMSSFVPRIVKQKRSFDALGEALDDGDRTVRVAFGVGLICRKSEHSMAMANAMSYMQERKLRMMPERNITLPAMLNALPLCADPKSMKLLNRFKRMATRHAVTLLPMFGDWKGTINSETNEYSNDIQLVSRSGQLMGVSLFDSPSSYNALLAAESGSGKSVLSNGLILSTIALGGRAWVIDVGGSYKKLCRILGGQYISFGRNEAPCLNPFPLVEDYQEESDTLLGLVIAMAYHTQNPDDYQISITRRTMGNLWKDHGREMTIDHIANALLEHDDQRIKDIGAQLYAFTTEGDYGSYFNGPNNVQFDNAMVVVELEELKARPHLQKVVLLQMIYQIQQECYLGKRDQRKVVLLDEAWEHLAKSQEVGTFLEGAYRRFRKYGAACVVVTQSLFDVYTAPNGQAIATNSPNTFLLRQKSEQIEQLKDKKVLTYSDGIFEIMKSVHTIPGLYGEIMVMTQQGIGVGKLLLDPYTNVMSSTTPAVNERIRVRMEEKGYTTDEAIREELGEDIMAIRAAAGMNRTERRNESMEFAA